MLRNKLTLSTKNTTATKIQSNLSYEVIKENSNRMKHFVGLTSAQFEVLVDLLNEICPLPPVLLWRVS